MRFLDVKTDYAFKKVFGSEQSKPILIDFLNAMIDFKDANITDLTIVDPYQIPLLKGMKDSYVDVKAMLSNQTKVIIEMQVLNVEGFEKRVLYNAAKLYSTQLNQAERYDTLEPIIALTITDFVMFRDLPNIISYWKLREKEHLVEYSDDIELIFVELPKFTKTESEIATITEKWLYFIQNAGQMHFIPQTFIEPPLVDAFGIANTSNLSEEEFEMQEKRHDFIWLQKKAIEKAQKDGLAQGWTQGRAEGRAEGETEGIRKGKLDMARGMLRDGLPIEMIMKYSGLLKDEIEHLHTK